MSSVAYSFKLLPWFLHLLAQYFRLNKKCDHEQHHSDTPLVTNVTESTIYTCPMHPEVQQSSPGDCPKCGMALEPMMPSLEEEENPELVDFQRRFW
ncbi:MAG: heavy metal-binding domain-containing protein, partial [Betaproteobacteria bacterium]|nr:heavy metal-binding domain-containing protein [Betaproteobacteria bacterium]